jgi:WD40 repeat protein
MASWSCLARRIRQSGSGAPRRERRTTNARRPLRPGYLSSLLARRQAGRVWVRGQDSPALGYCDGSGATDTKGHLESVSSVAFSLDGKLVVSGSYYKMVRLWDTVTGAVLQILKGHSNSVSSVAFSPDGKLVVSGSGDKTVRLWDAATGTALQMLEGHSSRVTSVAFSPDRKLVVSSSTDKTVRLWDAVTGAMQQTLEGYLDWVNSVAFSPDGKLVVSGSASGTIQLWERGALDREISKYSDVFSWLGLVELLEYQRALSPEFFHS